MVGRTDKRTADTARHSRESNNRADRGDDTLHDALPDAGPAREAGALRGPDRHWEIRLHNRLPAKEE